MIDRTRFPKLAAALNRRGEPLLIAAFAASDERAASAERALEAVEVETVAFREATA